MPLPDVQDLQGSNEDFFKTNPAKFFPETYTKNFNLNEGPEAEPAKPSPFLGLVANENADKKIYANTANYYQPSEVSDRYDRFLLGQDNEQINYELQSGWERTLNGGINLVNKVGAYLTQTAGFVIGAPFAAVGGIVNDVNKLNGGEGKVVNNGNAVSYMTDNLLTNFGEAWKEKVSEVNPIYKSLEYRNGTIWQKLFTSDWWLDDAIDRAGLGISMLIPGMLEAKGLGLFGTVAEEGNVLRATGYGSKAIQALADNPQLYGRFGKFAGNQIAKVMATGTADVETASLLAFKNMVQNAQKIELYSWNVIGQSALNAREAQMGIRRAFREQKEQGLTNLSDEQIESLAALGAVKAFRYTVPLALTASLIELPQIFKTAEHTKSMFKSFFNKETGQMIEGALEKTVRPSFLRVLGTAGLTGLEHGQNESMQVAVGRYLEESIAGKIVNRDGVPYVEKDERNPLTGMFQDYLDNVNDPNGQNNIALGTIQGIVMTLFGHGFKSFNGEYTKTDEANRKFIQTINQAAARRRFWALPEDFIDKNDDGSVKLHPDGSPVFNQQMLATMSMSIVDAADAYNKRMTAIKEGNLTKLQKMNYDSLASLAQNFFADKEGVEYLKNLLTMHANDQMKVGDILQNVKDGGIETTPGYQLQESFRYVDELKKAYDAIEQRHAGFTYLDVNLGNKNEVETRAIYIDSLKNAQYFNAADQIWLTDTLRKNNLKLAELNISEKVENPSSPQEEMGNKLIEENEILQKDLDDSKTNYKELVNRDTVKERFYAVRDEIRRAEEAVKKAEKDKDIKKTDTEEQKVINLKTKKGQQDIEIGRKYMVGRVVEKDANGNEVYRAPIIKILGENEDGTIKIETEDGVIKDIKKEVLYDYNLYTEDQVKNNKKNTFFLANWNKIFIHRGYKVNGQYAKGRLEYHPGTDTLYFKFKDSKGVERTTVLTREHFKAQPGYDQAMVTEDETLGPATEEQRVAKQEYLDSKVSETEAQSVLKERGSLVKDLIDKSKSRLDQVNRNITSSRTTLEGIRQRLEELSKTKKGEVKKRFTIEERQMISDLTSMRDKTQKSIDALEEEREQLEENLPILENILETLKTIPENYQQMVDDIKEDVENLKEVIAHSKEAVKQGKALISYIDRTLNDLIGEFNKFVQKLKKANPDVPLDLSELEENLSRFMGPEGIKEYLDNRLGYTEQVIQLQEQLGKEREKLKIPETEMKLEKLKDQIGEIESALEAMEKEQAEKSKILSLLEQVAREYEEKKRQEELIKKDSAIINNVMNTMKSAESGVENTKVTTKTFEPDPKKDEMVIGLATTFPTESRSKGPLPEHHKRADRFGARFTTFKNAQNIRGMIVNETTAKQLGLDGLMEHLKGTSDVDPSKTVAMVMVEETEDGSYIPIDEFGNRIETVNFDNAIYQVMPDPDNLQNMFRKDTPEYVKKDIIRQYRERHAAYLNDKSAKPKLIEPSFGHPENVTELNENNEKVEVAGARVPVTKSGLVTESDLSEEKVIYIDTSKDVVSFGSTTYRNAKGVPFLQTKSGYIKLNNRNFTEAEAETLFQAVKRLATILPTDKKLESDEALRLLSFLRSQVYWGIPKNKAGYNSVWFESTEDGLTLYMSNKEGLNFTFTPLGLEENKAAVVKAFQSIYNNVNSRLIDADYDKPYQQILSIAEDGEMTTRTWKNYQTYLLSDKFISADAKDPNNGKLRADGEIPLTTKVRPLESENDTNRTGVYFKIIDAEDAFVRPEAPKKAPTPQKRVLTPGGPQKATAKPATKTAEKKTVETTFDLKGESENEVTLGGGEVIKFTADGTELIESGNKKGIAFIEDAQFKKAVDRVMKAKNFDEATARQAIYQVVLNNLKADLEKLSTEEEEVTKEPEVEEDFIEDENDESSPFEEERLTEEERKRMQEDEDNIDEDDEYREQLSKQLDKFEPENWAKVQEFLGKNVPALTIYRTKNIIRGVNGVRAYGMFKRGAIYVWQNAEVGTTYHEVFHGVWNMFTDAKERNAIRKEFRERKGSFEERTTGKTIEYSKATESQLREKLAEEFRDYVQEGKKPPAAEKTQNKVLKFFSDLVDYIKNFFLGSKAESRAERLFEKIGTGYFKNYTANESKLSFAEKGIIDVDDAYATADAELSAIPGMTESEKHDIMQQMTYKTLTTLMKNNKSLFEIVKMPKDELYEILGKDVRGTALKAKKEANTILDQKVAEIEDLVNSGKLTIEKAKQLIEQKRKDAATLIADSESLWKRIVDNWDTLREKHEEVLRSYNIEFDDNDDTILRDENNSGKEDYQAANKIDGFRKVNSAVRLLLSTIPIVQSDGEPVRSSIGGIQLMQFGQVFSAIMNNSKGALTIQDFLEKLRLTAVYDKNYRKLYYRVTKTDYTEKSIDYNKLNIYDTQLITALYKTFRKVAPDVQMITYHENGDISVGSSNLSSARKLVKQRFINSMKKNLMSNGSFFQYSDQQKAYVGKPNSVANINIAPNDTEKMVDFLGKLGIIFNKKDIDSIRDVRILNEFRDSVINIRNSIANAKKIMTFGGKVFDIDGRLEFLAELKAKFENPEFDNTFIGIDGEALQTNIGPNPSTDLAETLASTKNFEDLKNNRQYSYLYTDSFAKGSVILAKIFNLSQSGNNVDTAHKLMSVSYADGYVDKKTGKKRETSRMSYQDRLIQEINFNINGYYYNLVPGDASMQWMTFMDNHVTSEQLSYGFKDSVFPIFRDYFLSEVELAYEKRPTASGRNTAELRFFKDILGETFHNDIMGMMKKKMPAEKIYEEKAAEINRAVEKFIKDNAEETKKLLMEYGIIEKNAGKEVSYNAEYLNIPNNENISEGALNREMNVLSVNYIINNIEMHKLLYSDPYQYSDELKRIKNFLSPRQSIVHDSPGMNRAYDNVWNRGYEQGDIGRTDFNREYFKTYTLNDVWSYDEVLGYGAYEEGNGAGLVSYKAYRNLRIRSANWNEAEESQYKYDVAWEKRYKSAGLTEKEISEKGLKLSEAEKKILEAGNPKIKSAYTPLKPIVAGNKNNGKSYNDVVLDKFALFPMSFRVLSELAKVEKASENNSMKLYNKMQENDVDYVVFESGRKVGGINKKSAYKEDLSFNDEMFSETSDNIPYSIVSIQTEVPSKDDNRATLGSQSTKLVTMDFMEAGVPIDFKIKDAEGNEITDVAEKYERWYSIPSEEEKRRTSPLYDKIKHNEDMLKAMIENNYTTLLKKLGIKDIGNKYVIEDFSVIAKTLRDEFLKREINDNLSAALRGFANGDAILEATPAYQQVKFILYSLVDKNIISPKINGGMKVQMPVTFLEKNKIEAKEIKTSDGKTKLVYQSSVLNFYRNNDGERVCEVMVGRWFPELDNLSDEELLKRLNSPEGRKILSGIGFRIPTQKQNSIDHFVIKGFLPKEFGDSIVVPSQLVEKAGSDFDIDKLTVYLKNVFLTARGELRAVPYLGTGESAKAKFGEMFEEMLAERLQRAETSLDYKKNLLQNVEAVLSDATSKKVVDRILKQQGDRIDRFLLSLGDLSPDEAVDNLKKVIEKLSNKIDRFTNDDVQDALKEVFIERMYKNSLENEYIQSMQDLVSDEANFDKLVKPNSAKELKDLSKEIVEATGGKVFDYKEVGNMLNRSFMSSLRHAFVSGRYAIGIAAVNQTNHANNQRQLMYLDLEKLNQLSEEDKFWLGDGKLKFIDDKGNAAFNTIKVKGKDVATLSMIKNAEGKVISDYVAQFIDGYVDISKGPWIIQLGATQNTASTWLFLVKMGVPMDTIAYFMNQPIVRDYLQKIDTSGYSWLFIDDYVDAMNEKYSTTENVSKIKNIPSPKVLKEMLGRDSSKMSPRQKAQQQYVLKEFLKYAKMANQLFQFTQGTNFDTANLNDPYIIFKKSMQLERAKKTIISSVDEMLDNSFLGELYDKITAMRDALGQTVLMSDRGNVRNVMESVLEDFIDLPDREFIKISQKAVGDMFDWAMQTSDKFAMKVNQAIQRTLLGQDNFVKDVDDFVQSIRKDSSHPLHYNPVIKDLNAMYSERREGVNNLVIENRANKIYDQNQIIGGFDEIKRYLENTNSKLFNKLVTVSIIQSGLSKSRISFTDLLPYEDFKKVYNETLANLEQLPNLQDFKNLNVFQRNNWNNDDIVAYERARWSQYGDSEAVYNRNMRFNNMRSVRDAINKGEIPRLLKLSTKSRSGASDHVVYTWENMSIPLKKRIEMKRSGDFSFMNKGLFQKVYDEYGNPLKTSFTNDEGVTFESYIYKMINAWGDGYRANEFYDTARPSVIDNGFTKVRDEIIETPNGKEKHSGEVDNATIISYFMGEGMKAAKTITPKEVSKLSTEQKARLLTLEDKIKGEGLSAAEMRELKQLRTQIGKEIKKNC